MINAMIKCCKSFLETRAVDLLFDTYETIVKMLDKSK